VKKKVSAKKAAPEKSEMVEKKTPTKMAESPTPKANVPKAPTVKKTAQKSESSSSSPISASALDGFTDFKPYEEAKGEEYMNERQEEHFRGLLKSWKRQLMEEVDRTLHYMQDEAANYPDPNDRASQESDFTMELRTRDRERKLIKKIDEALGSIDTHEYGRCESCGVNIGIRRLEARPTATLCIDCKELDEIRERQRS
jgi:DnaK suppressor protein